MTADGKVTMNAVGETIVMAKGAETSNCYEARSAQYTLKVTETSGIAGITVDSIRRGAVYNTAGQRVAQPRKGIYIRNGRKITVK